MIITIPMTKAVVARPEESLLRPIAFGKLPLENSK